MNGGISLGFANTKGDVGESTRKSKSFKEQMEEQILKMKQIPVNKKVLLSGENGTAKSSLALGIMTHDLQPNEVIIYVDIDNSGLEIAKDFYKDAWNNNQIIIYRPAEYMRREDGFKVKDEEKTIHAISNIAMDVEGLLKEDINVKGVIVDGVSFVLEFCEAFMRLEEDISVADGVPMQKWKIRNAAFRDFSSPYMSLPVPVIFVSHADFIPELQEENSDDFGFSSVKQRFIDECSMRFILTKTDDEDLTDYVATIKKNRSDLTTENMQFVFLTRNKKTNDIVSDLEDISNTIFPHKTNGNKK